MLKTMWNKLTGYWNSFSDWVASWLPGLKTQLTTGLGAVGMGAGLLQEYVTGIPLDKLIGPTKVAIVSVVLFTLSFWFRRLSNRTA